MSFLKLSLPKLQYFIIESIFRFFSLCRSFRAKSVEPVSTIFAFLCLLGDGGWGMGDGGWGGFSVGVTYFST